MKRSAIVVVIAAFLAAVPAAQSAGPPTQSPAGDGLAIIVHRSNPVDNLTRAELRRIFMLEMQTWSSGRRITVVLREKGQPDRADAIRLICGMSEDEYDMDIQFRMFRGTIRQGPRDILSASAMLRFVFSVPGAIGYVPATEADNMTKVLRVDGMLPIDSQYPLRVRPRSPR